MLVLVMIAVALLVVTVALQVFQIKRGVGIDLSPIGQMFSSVEKSHERTERCVRDEIGKNREEVAAGGKASRDEMNAALKGSSLMLSNTVSELGRMQTERLEILSDQFIRLAADTDQKLGAMRLETTAGVRAVRDEVAAVLQAFSEKIGNAIETLSGFQRSNLSRVTDELSKLTESNDRKLEAARATVDERLKHIQEDSGRKLDAMRVEAGLGSKQMRDELGLSLTNFTHRLTAQVGTLTDSSEKRMEALRGIVEERLRLLQEDNSKSLEQMRHTVDEKLHGALEQRLGESFKIVSERLEQVYKGLGEMQSLATGVGDLKRVLTNVKSRGTWGEVQLSAMLEQVLSPEQFESNVAVRDGAERVEFAIKLPNRGDDSNQVLYLPIDAKFPVEDYQRLVEAQDRGDADAAELAAKQLEVRIRQCAKDICTKYINPPKTTDFAILFLPTEGLFAEVLRRAGLADLIQRECRVMIAGPTTLWAVLNSLQMGFRTLAIQKRSSEVWTVLGAVKTEFVKYGETLAKVQKKLEEASQTIENDVARRSRAIERKLRSVEELPLEQSDALLLTTSGDLEKFAADEV